MTAAAERATRWNIENRERRNKKTRERFLAKKLRAVALMGGQCSECGFNKHPAALDFHHVDRATKTLPIAWLLSRSWEAVEAELKKCVLLCANCHRIAHANAIPE